MKTEDFDYYLPKELIAQTPLKNRSDSRLLVLDKNTGEITHKHFYDIVDYLSEGDVLVMNNSKVIPSRMHGIKECTGAHIEVLMLKDLGDDCWETLVRPARRIHKGEIVSFGEGLLKLECTEELNDGLRHFKLIYEGILMEILEKLGTMPLPPYIHEQLKDQDRYQTVYAKTYGSAAAPTAGLHFTKELLKKIEAKGVKICYVTLHVGLGTFRPVNESDIEAHEMHSEYYVISQEVADELNAAKASGKRIVSVGTTSTRTLESATVDGKITNLSSWTSIFIYPGYKFKFIDAQITNFHLPKSTLIMLVSAIAGRENILNAYNEAVKEKYRFFSFGDAMFIK